MNKLRSIAVLLLTFHLLLTPFASAQIATPEVGGGVIAEGSITVTGYDGGEPPAFQIMNANGAVIASGLIDQPYMQSVTFVATPGSQATLIATGNTSYKGTSVTAIAAPDGALHFSLVLEAATPVLVEEADSTPTKDESTSSDSPLLTSLEPVSTPTSDTISSSDDPPLMSLDAETADVAVSLSFGGSTPAESNVALYDEMDNLIGSLTSLNGAPVLFEGVPYASGYSLNVEGSWWYPDTTSEIFTIDGTSSNSITISMVPYDSVSLTVTGVSTNARQLDQPLTLTVSGDGTAGGDSLALSLDTGTGNLVGTVIVPKRSLSLTMAAGQTTYTSDSLPMTVDLSAVGGSSHSVSINLTPSPLYVVFNLTVPQGAIAAGWITITQGEIYIDQIYVAAGTTSVTSQFDWAYGTYDWSFAPGGAIPPASGTFSFGSGGAQVPIELALVPNGIIEVNTTFPTGIDDLSKSGWVSIYELDNSVIESRYVLNLETVLVGPFVYGDYLVSVQPDDSRLVTNSPTQFAISESSQTLNVELRAFDSLEPVMVTFRVTGPDGLPAVDGWIHVFSTNETYELDSTGEIELNFAGWYQVYFSVGAHSSSDTTYDSWVPSDGDLVEIQLQDKCRYVILNVVNEDSDPITNLVIPDGRGVDYSTFDGQWYGLIFDDGVNSITVSVEDPSGIYQPLIDVSIPLTGDVTTSTLMMSLAPDLVSNVSFDIEFEDGLPVLEPGSSDGPVLTLIGVDDPQIQMTGTLNEYGIATFAYVAPGDYQLDFDIGTLDWIYSEPNPKVVSITASDQRFDIEVAKEELIQVPILIETSDGQPLDGPVVLKFYGDDYIEYTIDGSTTISLPIDGYEFTYSGTARYAPGQPPFVEVTESPDPITLTFTRVGTVPLENDGDDDSNDDGSNDDGNSDEDGTPGGDDDDGTSGGDDGGNSDDGNNDDRRDDDTTGGNGGDGGRGGDGGDGGNTVPIDTGGNGGSGYTGGKGGDGGSALPIGTGGNGGSGGDGGRGGDGGSAAPVGDGGNGSTGGIGGSGGDGGAGGSFGNGADGGNGSSGGTGGRGGAGGLFGNGGDGGNGGAGTSGSAIGDVGDEPGEEEPEDTDPEESSPVAPVLSPIDQIIVMIFTFIYKLFITAFDMLGLTDIADQWRASLEQLYERYGIPYEPAPAND